MPTRSYSQPKTRADSASDAIASAYIVAIQLSEAPATEPMWNDTRGKSAYPAAMRAPARRKSQNGRGNGPLFPVEGGRAPSPFPGSILQV
jgi:hypothetical protein